MNGAAGIDRGLASQGRRVRLLAATLAGAFAATAGTAFAGGMAVEPGDVLSVTIDEAPKIGRPEVKVGADGRIMLPVVGGVSVGGSDLDTIQQRIVDLLVAKDLIRQPTVTVEIASYRPFYIGGAVASPGAMPYEPGLTVRHALILAGGLKRGEGSEGTSAEDLVELKTKWQTTNFALLQAGSQIARLQAELNHSDKADFDRIDATYVSDADRVEIVDLDKGMLVDHAAGWEANQKHMHDALALIDLEIDTLTKQADLQNQERAVQQDQVAKARTLVEKGVMPLPRLQELEREASRLARDLLDIQAFTARARQAKQDQQYQLETADAEWRADVQGQLSSAILQRAQLEASVQVLASSMLAAGILLGGDAPELTPEVVLHRQTDQGDKAMKATLEDPIEPGDVLEISIARAPVQG